MMTNGKLEGWFVRFLVVLCLAILLVRRFEALSHLRESIDFFLAVMAISFGPYFVALAFQLKSNETGTIWKKSWPVGIIVGIWVLTLGVVGLVRLLK